MWISFCFWQIRIDTYCSRLDGRTTALVRFDFAIFFFGRVKLRLSGVALHRCTLSFHACLSLSFVNFLADRSSVPAAEFSFRSHPDDCCYRKVRILKTCLLNWTLKSSSQLNLFVISCFSVFLCLLY